MRHTFSSGRGNSYCEGTREIIYYVDACAGRGMDDAGNQGSPVRAAIEAATAKGQLRDKFGKSVDIHVIAIEKKPARFNALRENLKLRRHNGSCAKGHVKRSPAWRYSS